ncbi:DUF4280 domain-containing protein [soil metagenome]
MAMQTCTGGLLQCTFGMAPAMFNATPKTVITSSMMAGNILDNKPMLNVMPFGMCSSLANPTVAAATAAAFGVLTPMPCIPITPAPWVPGSPTVILCNAPALNNSSKLMCVYGGVIGFIQPGQFKHFIP